MDFFVSIVQFVIQLTRDFQFMKQSVLNSGYPSLMNIDTSLGLSDCQAICRNNCSCTACNTVFTNGTGCQFWRDKLPRAQVGDANQEELYVLSSSKDTGNLWRNLSIICGVVGLVIILIFSCSPRKFGGRVRREVQSHEAGASGIAGDREGKKVKLPEVRATGSTGDRKEKKVKFLEPPASGITGDRGGKKVKPLEVGASGTTGDREGKKGQPRDGEVSGGKTADTKKKKVTFLLRTDE
ncbi:unnamed protein product, partial [Vitis vinifera]